MTTTARRVVSIVQWAGIAGLADDGTSMATARLLAGGEGPNVVKVGRRVGVRLGDHAQWARSKPWAKYLAATAAAKCKSVSAKCKHQEPVKSARVETTAQTKDTSRSV